MAHDRLTFGSHNLVLSFAGSAISSDDTTSRTIRVAVHAYLIHIMPVLSFRTNPLDALAVFEDVIFNATRAQVELVGESPALRVIADAACRTIAVHFIEVLTGRTFHSTLASKLSRYGVIVRVVPLRVNNHIQLETRHA